MGCDIHIVIEQKLKGETKWVGLLSTDKMKERPELAKRDYEFFGEIANVRGKGSRCPQNLPKDVSDLAWIEYMRHPVDHHSVSHMDLEELCLIHNTINPDRSRMQHAVYDLVGNFYDEDGEQYRAVFWFDN